MVKCPVPGCPNTKQDGHAMCYEHWVQVPQALQKPIYHANKRVQAELASIPSQDALNEKVAEAVAYVVRTEEEVSQ